MYRYPTLLDIDEIELEKDYKQQQFWMTHGRLWLLTMFLFRQYGWLVQHTICKIKDHKLVDNGYATPDSGCIQMSCERYQLVVLEGD